MNLKDATSEDMARELARLRGEILMLQRWAGGEAVPAVRLFGLLNGFETIIRAEGIVGISKETQDRVEDLLEVVDRGEQPTDPVHVASRLGSVGVSSTDAATVMQLCRLQDRFLNAIDRIASAPGSKFSYLNSKIGAEAQWTGPLHYMEIVEESVAGKLVAVHAPSVPRPGEIIEQMSGPDMEVIAVSHLLVQQPDSAGKKRNVLVPHVIVKQLEDDEARE